MDKLYIPYLFLYYFYSFTHIILKNSNIVLLYLLKFIYKPFYNIITSYIIIIIYLFENPLFEKQIKNNNSPYKIYN